MQTASNSATCSSCGAEARKIITKGILFTAERVCDKAENKYAFGMSQKDQLEDIRRERKEREDEWSQTPDHLDEAAPLRSMKDIAQEMGVFAHAS